MNQTNSIKTPQANDDIRLWETYLQGAINARSVCKVRTSHLEQTAGEREQNYLKQLSANAHLIFQKTSLSKRGNAYQRQALELIKLRRRLAPDDSPVHQEAGVFLAIVNIHQAVQSMLGRIDRLIQLHCAMESQLRELQCLVEKIRSSRAVDGTEIFPLIQLIRNSAADLTIQTDDWLHLSRQIAYYDLKQSENNSLALASALQCCFLAAQIFGKEQNRRENLVRQTPRFLQFDFQYESLLIASVLKDVGRWAESKAEPDSVRAHHSEISAGLVSRISGLPVAVVRLVREHHECVDGSGLPAGIEGTEQHFESRLLAVMTRWVELYNQQAELDEVCAIDTASDILLKETSQNRWEKLSTNLLLDILGVRPMSETVQSPFQQDAKPNWQIPRPHFLDALHKKNPASLYQQR